MRAARHKASGLLDYVHSSSSLRWGRAGRTLPSGKEVSGDHNDTGCCRRVCSRVLRVAKILARRPESRVPHRLWDAFTSPTARRVAVWGVPTVWTAWNAGLLAPPNTSDDE